MTAKDIIPIVLLLAILGLLIKVFQFTKTLQPSLDAGTPKRLPPPSYSDETQEEDGIIKTRKPRTVRVKITYNRMVKLLQDGIPKSEETLLELYNKKHKKPIKMANVKQFLKWLHGRDMVMYEDFEEGKVWGLPEMFEDGELIEEYANKLKK